MFDAFNNKRDLQMYSRFHVTLALFLALVILSASSLDRHGARAAGAFGTTNEMVYDEANLANIQVQWIASKTGWKELSIPIIKRTSREELSNLFFGLAGELTVRVPPMEPSPEFGK